MLDGFDENPLNIFKEFFPGKKMTNTSRKRRGRIRPKTTLLKGKLGFFLYL